MYFGARAMFSSVISRRAWKDSLILFSRVSSTTLREVSSAEKSCCLLRTKELNYLRGCCDLNHRSYSYGRSVQSASRCVKNSKWRNKKTAASQSQGESISGPGRLLFAGACFGLAGLSYGLWHFLKQRRFPEVLALSDSDNNSRAKQFNFIADVVEKASPAVVYIEIKGRVPFHPGLATVSNGSGFVVRENGLILTNAHVVANKPAVIVKLNDGRSFEGRVQAVDPVSDLATVKIDCNGLSTIPLGESSKIRPGEWVVAMGSPLSLTNTVTAGIISTVHRGSQELGIHNRDMGYIQTDAVINFGNSGGPLVNLNGEAIGINTMKVTTGISFAIPSDNARDFLMKAEKLQKKVESKGWFGSPSHRSPTKPRYIGITMLTLTPAILVELRQRMGDFPNVTHGVLVHKVGLDSPADRGGLRAGDVVTGINGVAVQSSADVYRAIEASASLQFTVRRGRETLALKINPEQAD
ncbi:serine protease HTRA2, mitochondrial-like [Liolophura sinensis]|uniref:serine protease HTRA2, mitochondrial-like n=1 Tax=Liolophura sinensis TaxID=3198878 RepID=UPI00315816D2